MVASSCRRCGKVVRNGTICAGCRDKSRNGNRPASPAYDAEYKRNRRIVIGRTTARIRAGDYPQCIICGNAIVLVSELSCEHVTPLRNGGDNRLANLGPAHKRCNYGWNRGG